MKVKVDSYNVNKNLNLDRSMKFISFADIHYGVLQQLFYKGYIDKFYEYMIKNSNGVDAILIPGDLILWIYEYQDSNFLKALSNDLKNLSFSMSAPICISYGNHDLPFKEHEMTLEEKQLWSLKRYLDDRYNGVYVLDNEQIRFNNLVVTGFSPSRSAYATSAMPDPALDMAYETFVNCNFNFNNDDVNILLSHDNKFFTYRKNADKLKDLYSKLTLILGGHLHDGFVPLWLQSLLKGRLKDYGVWEKVPLSIDMCRGAFKVSGKSTSDFIGPSESVIKLEEDEALSIINRGIAKYSWIIPNMPSYTEVAVSSEEDVLKRKIL